MDLHPVLEPYVLHEVIIAIAVLGAILWTWIIVKYSEHWLIALGPLTYFINVIAYNSVALLGNMDAIDLSMWSHAVRLHSMFLMIALGFFHANRFKHRIPPV